MKPIFMKKGFWAAWTTAFTAFVLSLSVPVGTQVVFDLQTPIMQPTWRVILEWAKVIPEQHRKINPPSLDPVIQQLPYILIGYFILSGILVGVLWLGAKANNMRRPNQAL